MARASDPVTGEARDGQLSFAILTSDEEGRSALFVTLLRWAGTSQ
jgi:hypothetical protein